MAKPLVIDPTHHAVQLAQKVEFICVVCKKCSCHTRDRLEKECRSETFAQENHFLQSATHFASPPARPGDFTQSM